MAIVNVDLSEYDALRESVKEKKERIKALEKEIEEYKEGAKTVIITKMCRKKFDVHYLIDKTMKNAMMHISFFFPGSPVSDLFKKLEAPLRNGMINALEEYMRNRTYSDLEYEVLSSSTEVKGFDDVRIRIEQQIEQEAKQELDGLKASLKAAKDEYDNRCAELVPKIQKSVKAQYESNIELLSNQSNSRAEEIKVLNKRINELSDTINSKDSELAKVKEETAHSYIRYLSGLYDEDEIIDNAKVIGNVSSLYDIGGEYYESLKESYNVQINQELWDKVRIGFVTIN